MLRKFGIIAVLSLIVAALAAVPALAANPHTVPSGDPVTCECLDAETVVCSGELAGLGQADSIQIIIDVTGGCSTSQNPPKNNPGGHIQDESGEIQVGKGGRAPFSEDVTVDCPNGLNPFFGRTADITVVEFGNPTNVLAEFEDVPIQ
jgi:hypothetical protein